MLIVDRIESGLAVCEREDGTMITLSLDRFEPEAYENGVYRETDCGKLIYDEAETIRRREENAALLAELFGEEAVEE